MAAPGAPSPQPFPGTAPAGAGRALSRAACSRAAGARASLRPRARRGRESAAEVAGTPEPPDPGAARAGGGEAAPPGRRFFFGRPALVGAGCRRRGGAGPRRFGCFRSLAAFSLNAASHPHSLRVLGRSPLPSEPRFCLLQAGTVTEPVS